MAEIRLGPVYAGSGKQRVRADQRAGKWLARGRCLWRGLLQEVFSIRLRFRDPDAPKSVSYAVDLRPRVIYKFAFRIAPTQWKLVMDTTNIPVGAATGPTQAEVDRLSWWHTITFPNGTVTKGQRSRETLESAAGHVFGPLSLEGKSLLDVGTWNGYFASEAVKRGATSVTALDSFIWEQSPVSYEGFQLVRKYLMPNCNVVRLDVMDLTARIGTFDVTLFLGVLYHLKHPLYALERLAEVTRECLVLDTHLDAVSEPRAAAIFYPGKELNNDPSNWWGPNSLCVEGMLKTVGFKKVDYIDWYKQRGIFHAWK